IAFGPPLPFGVIGLSELFDIVTTRPLSNDERLLINNWLPENLKVHNCMHLKMKEESLNVLITGAEYIFLPSFEISDDDLGRVLEKAISKQDILVQTKENVEQDSLMSVKNIRPHIYGLRLHNTGSGMAIEAVLSLLPKATCRPSELIAGLFPDRQFTEFTVYRKECLINEAGNLIALWKDSI
ncbi:MAG: DUF2344 domain-containing protein, partial [Smithella sp.]